MHIYILILEQEILAAFPHLTVETSTAYCNLYFTLCRNKNIAYVREHWRCQSWKTNIPVAQIGSSRDTRVSEPNYCNSNQDSYSEMRENGGGRGWCSVENLKNKLCKNKMRPSKMTDVKEKKCGHSKPKPAHFSSMSEWMDVGEDGWRTMQEHCKTKAS